MKKIIILIIILVSSAFALTVYSQQSDLEIKYNRATEIKFKYQIDGASLKRVIKDNPKDKIEITIGENTKGLLGGVGDFNPKVKIARWDDEVSLTLTPKDLDKVTTKDKTLDLSNGKIKVGTPKTDYQIYDLPVSADNPEGALEYEIDLKEKPATNVIEFQLDTQGLDFFYQPELTEQEIKDGASRPENVVGSYAVYASENKINYVGGKEYKVGKVGHIYRPKIIDSAGTEVWGVLNIDKGILSVTIPQEFLEKAIYPVRHAAGLTFGYDTHGGSYGAWSANYVAASGDSVYSPASDGTLNSITIYCAKNSDAGNAKMAIYNTADALIDYTDGVAINTLAEYTANVVLGASVSTAVSYRISWKSDITINYYYDAIAGTYAYRYAASTYANAFPNPITWTTSAGNNQKISIWATYTASGGEATTPTINVRISGQTKIKGNVRIIK